MNANVDMNLHDFVRLRLVAATRPDVDALQRQLGLQAVDTAGDADIVIRFVDEFTELKTMNILGNWEYGYTDDAFWILRGNQGQDVAVKLHLDEFGKGCEIVCRRPTAAIPLLGSIINLTALAKGLLPLHASAFLFEGESVLVTGWSKGGKTESLLAFAEHGATYVGDEWIYINADSGTMHGLPQRIHLWDWHLDSAVHRSRLTTTQWLKLAGLRVLTSALRPFAGGQGGVAKTIQSLFDSAQQRRHVRLSPERLFRGRVQSAAAFPQRLFFLASHAASSTEVRPISEDEVVARMAVSLEHEFESLLSCYRHFRFAFPGRTNSLLESLPDLLRTRLAAAFQHKEALAVWHPYPVPTRDLFHAMLPHVHMNPSHQRGSSTTNSSHVNLDVPHSPFPAQSLPNQSQNHNPQSAMLSRLALENGTR